MWKKKNGVLYNWSRMIGLRGVKEEKMDAKIGRVRNISSSRF